MSQQNGPTGLYTFRSMPPAPLLRTESFAQQFLTFKLSASQAGAALKSISTFYPDECSFSQSGILRTFLNFSSSIAEEKLLRKLS